MIDGLDFLQGLTQFQFLRPFYLLALVIPLGLFYLHRRYARHQNAWDDLIEPHLLDAILPQQGRGRHFSPWGVSVSMLCCLLVALAGPSWDLHRSDAANRVPLVIALELTPDMLDQDVQPDRLAYAKQIIKKIALERRGAKTALIVFAGGANTVVPLTDDGELINFYLSDLQPELMPRQGNAPDKALALASRLLSAESRESALLLLTSDLDNIVPDRFTTTMPNLRVLAMTLGTAGHDTLSQGAASLRVDTIGSAGGENIDLERVQDWLHEVAQRNQNIEEESPPVDLAFIFLIPTALLALAWMRSGWSRPWNG